MDKSSVAAEENHGRTYDSMASAPKPIGSLVQINSIAIDIRCAMEEIEPPVHEHFSIRGFVAGMRKKDWKRCSPFGSEGGDSNLVDNLPPLSIPNFRWWQCSNCVPDVASERTTLEELPLANRNDAGTSSCLNGDGQKDGSFSHNIQRTGDESGLSDSRCKEVNNPSNKVINSSSWTNEKHKAATSGGREKTDIGENEGGNTHACVTEDVPCQIREKPHNTADAIDMVPVVENPSTRDNESENASSGSDGAVTALLHRKKPKLRSLADIMDEEKNSIGEHPRTRSTSSSGMQIKSSEVEADLDPQLHLDVPADSAKSTKSPQRKRKSAFEEDRGPLEITCPIGTAKRVKVSTSVAEKTCRRVEIADSESEGNASARLDMRHNAKTQQIKSKKNKALDIGRKMRQTHIDSRTVPMREAPKTNGMHSANLQKHVASETDFGNMGHVPSTMGKEMEPYFTSFLSEQQMDRISNLSKGKRPEVEGDHSPLMPQSKSIFGDCNVQGEVALDLTLNSYMAAERNYNDQISSRQHRSIPDLNESFTEKTPMVQGKQLPTVSEKRSLILQRNLFQETFASCSKEMVREGKRKLGASQPHAVQNMDNNVEPGGVSDDIQLEIAELLAKNLSEGINSPGRGSPSIYMDGCPGMISFPSTSRSSVSSASGKMGVSQGILNFSQAKNCHLDGGKQEDSQSRHFSSFTSSQQRKTQYPASNSVMSGPRPTEGADLLWAPRGKNVPLHLSVTQSRSIQPNTLGVRSFPDHCYTGKNVCDTKVVEEKNAHDASAVREGRIGPSLKSVGSLDAYSNDTIPAMQLLSLMDRGIVSGPSFKVGTNSFLDKPSSPCSHHLRLNGNENQNDSFQKAPFFSRGGHQEGLPRLLNGVCFPSESLRKSYLRGQMPPEQGNSKAVHFQGASNTLVQPTRSNLALGVCTLNRNPADFSFPDATNEFTISAKDLKPRRRNTLKKKSHHVNVEGQKRPRARKDATVKECKKKITEDSL